MALNTEDVAYLVAIVEKSPSNYPRRQEIIDHLQYAWRQSSVRGQPWRSPVEPTFCSIGVVEVDAAKEDRP